MSFVNTILVNSFKLYQQQRYCKMLYIQKIIAIKYYDVCLFSS